MRLFDFDAEIVWALSIGAMAAFGMVLIAWVIL